MIDTHSHLLPGLDDGASSMGESLELARAAVSSGVREVVCTPHLRSPGDPSASQAGEILDEVQEALRRAGVSLRLHLGYEVTFSFAMEMDVETLRSYCMGPGGRALLVEVPYDGWPPYAEEAVFRWRLGGLWPILAHPERNERAQRNPALVTRLVSLGAVVQGTGPSLAGLFGPRARRFLLSLIGQGQVVLLASDAHSPRSRAGALGELARELMRALPGVDVDRLTRSNPERALRGEMLEPLEPISVPSRWGKLLRKA
ncbi:MAG: hypothetical protein M5U22_15290 [Thermoleophilia bacterium]|nr:hypothetical protein [Thermoleophilia bacterium]